MYSGKFKMSTRNTFHQFSPEETFKHCYCISKVRGICLAL